MIRNPYLLRLLPLLVAMAPATFAAPTLAPTAFQCEGLADAAQVDTAQPRFSWSLQSAERDTLQAAYQLRVTEVDAAGRPLGEPRETPRIKSDKSQWRTVDGFAAAARTTYDWQVRVWDNHGNESAWSAPRRFGTGLLDIKWPADWIGDGQVVARGATAPARYFRHTFKLPEAPVRARLYLSAFGLAEPWLNGRPVTTDKFVPGWPDYRQRVFYVAYDVTNLVQAGENAWGLILGDGWFSGTMMLEHQYGPEPTVSAFIDVVYADGRKATIRTGKDWQWTDDGPIRLNSIYHGEDYDARRGDDDWSRIAGAGAWKWKPVSVRAARRVFQTFTARLSPPVRTIERLKPISVKEVAPGVFQYDLGQNMVGWAKLKVRAKAGQEIGLRFAEMLDAKGRIYTANLRGARAQAHYIARGGGVEEWEPRFTYFGFRYIEVTGLIRPEADAIEGVVVHSDLERIGNFDCSEPMLNQLYRNALWGQKGNFLELPTDCPQRDERLGWMGDAQVFAPTALLNMDAGNFYRQWLFAVRDSFRDGPDGGYGDVAPFIGTGHGSAGWSEAGVIVPWVTWLNTGDRRVLEESLPSVQYYIESMANQAPDGIRRSPKSYGDWLSPGFEAGQAPPDYDLIATAYLAHAADLAAQMADVLGESELAARDRALRAKVKAAFQRKYISTDGRVAGDVQTSYLLALAFDLAPAELRPRLIEHLLKRIAEKDDHLATGFLGTPLLLPVLTELGRTDLAYKILEQTSYPGWLFSVKNGATTVWERWDSWTPEGFNPRGMNSFNHYAYGSVVSWFYDTIAGLQLLPEFPGWKRFRIAPMPGGGLTHAQASIVTPHGVAASRWEILGGRLRLSVKIPPNTGAEVLLPCDGAGEIRLDGKPLQDAEPAPGLGATPRTKVVLPSGDYEFDLPFAHP